jgi:hypothetical protein
MRQSTQNNQKDNDILIDDKQVHVVCKDNEGTITYSASTKDYADYLQAQAVTLETRRR